MGDFWQHFEFNWYYGGSNWEIPCSFLNDSENRRKTAKKIENICVTPVIETIDFFVFVTMKEIKEQS